jgi:hypothetical protein
LVTTQNVTQQITTSYPVTVTATQQITTTQPTTVVSTLVSTQN